MYVYVPSEGVPPTTANPTMDSSVLAVSAAPAAGALPAGAVSQPATPSFTHQAQAQAPAQHQQVAPMPGSTPNGYLYVPPPPPLAPLAALPPPPPLPVPTSASDTATAPPGVLTSMKTPSGPAAGPGPAGQQGTVGAAAPSAAILPQIQVGVPPGTGAAPAVSVGGVLTSAQLQQQQLYQQQQQQQQQISLLQQQSATVLTGAGGTTPATMSPLGVSMMSQPSLDGSGRFILHPQQQQEHHLAQQHQQQQQTQQQQQVQLQQQQQQQQQQVVLQQCGQGPQQQVPQIALQQFQQQQPQMMAGGMVVPQQQFVAHTTQIPQQQFGTQYYQQVTSMPQALPQHTPQPLTCEGQTSMVGLPGTTTTFVGGSVVPGAMPGVSVGGVGMLPQQAMPPGTCLSSGQVECGQPRRTARGFDGPRKERTLTESDLRGFLPVAENLKEVLQKDIHDVDPWVLLRKARTLRKKIRVAWYHLMRPPQDLTPTERVKASRLPEFEAALARLDETARQLGLLPATEEAVLQEGARLMLLAKEDLEAFWKFAPEGSTTLSASLEKSNSSSGILCEGDGEEPPCIDEHVAALGRRTPKAEGEGDNDMEEDEEGEEGGQWSKVSMYRKFVQSAAHHMAKVRRIQARVATKGTARPPALSF